MSAITKGPWTAEYDELNPSRGQVYVEGPEGWVHQPICACDYSDDTDENEANARASAALPDLIEALKHLVHWHDQLGPRDIAKAEAALKKAGVLS